MDQKYDHMSVSGVLVYQPSSLGKFVENFETNLMDFFNPEVVY